MKNIYKFSIAPMLHYTDRHCRFLHRILTKNSLLYTEMITENNFLFLQNKQIKINLNEHPIAIQFAGKNPEKLAKCAKLAYLSGYDEINLNVGCPSKKIKKLGVGIYLMKNIPLLIKIIQKMNNAIPFPVSIKTRIGLDNINDYFSLHNFIKKISENTRSKKFIIHARTAISSGINSKQNRNIPPLNYKIVHKIKKNFPNLEIVLNGGIKSITDIKLHLKHVDGIMVGRAAYNNPIMLHNIDSEIYHTQQKKISIQDFLNCTCNYIEKELYLGTKLHHITRHLLGLFYKIPGSRMWRQYLSKHSHKKDANLEILDTALQFIHKQYK